MATNTTHTTSTEVVVERLIRATPQRIFRALTVASELEKWFFTDVRTDPRPGGAYRMEWKAGQGCEETDHSRIGTYLEVVPDRRLVFEWLGVPDERHDRGYSLRGAHTVVTITLTPEGDATRLRLVHTGFADSDHGHTTAASHTNGWTFYMGNLDRYLTGGADERAREFRQLVK